MQAYSAIFKVFINLHYGMKYSYRCWDKTFESASKPTTVDSSFLNIIIQSMDYAGLPCMAIENP